MILAFIIVSVIGCFAAAVSGDLWLAACVAINLAAVVAGEMRQTSRGRRGRGRDGMRPWRVYEEGGVSHSVIALDEADALAVWREQMLRDGLTAADLDENESPDVEEIDAERAAGTTYYDDDQPMGSLLDEYKRDMSRRYVGCSEW